MTIDTNENASGPKYLNPDFVFKKPAIHGRLRSTLIKEVWKKENSIALEKYERKTKKTPLNFKRQTKLQ